MDWLADWKNGLTQIIWNRPVSAKVYWWITDLLKISLVMLPNMGKLLKNTYNPANYLKNWPI